MVKEFYYQARYYNTYVEILINRKIITDMAQINNIFSQFENLTFSFLEIKNIIIPKSNEIIIINCQLSEYGGNT